jgi:2'-5' RNA ligase
MDLKTIPQIPGYNYSEYLLVLNPHEDLRNKIVQVKKEFSEKYKAPAAFYSKPHITLVNFIQFEMREDRLVSHLNKITMSYRPFKVDLKDYGSFPSHTIFINVESKQQVKNLLKELKPVQHLMALNKENKPHFMDNPHLTVARKLLPWQYEKGWLEYSNSHFTGRFVADNMLLMKRKPGEKYQYVKRFDFLNLSAKGQQIELFI